MISRDELIEYVNWWIDFKNRYSALISEYTDNGKYADAWRVFDAESPIGENGNNSVDFDDASEMNQIYDLEEFLSSIVYDMKAGISRVEFDEDGWTVI